MSDDWTYEGWVVDKQDTANIRYYSTGKFSRADTADFDGAGPGKGPGPGLNFPGQDFITGVPSRPDLSAPRYAIRITLEPSPDNASGPFFLTLLSTDSPSVSPPGNRATGEFALQNVMSERLPTAHITVAR